MRGHQTIKKYTLFSLLLVTFILSIDFADAKNGKWKPGNENYRRFPNDRKLLSGRRIPTGKTIQNDRSLQIDGIMQNDGRIPTGKTIQNYRSLQTDGIMQNDGRIPTGKTIQNGRRLQIDGQMQNDRRMPIGRTLQNDKRMLNDRKIKNDRIMQYNRRVHSPSITDGIMQKDGRIRINRILENDRLSENELQKKIDSLTQNKNMQKEKRVQDGRRTLNTRMQNERKTQNDLKEQNTGRILDERNQKIINARRTRYDKRMWAATPHRTVRQGDWAASPPRAAQRMINDSLNSINITAPKYESPEDNQSKQGWIDFWSHLMSEMGSIHAATSGDHNLLTTRACHIIATTYISALTDYRRYFTLRYFYEDNLAYEVGYLVSEIISKYQRMLELYDLVTQYYYKHEANQYATVPYVLYMYTNVLEMGTVISHLCNMLNEMEDKYKYIPVKQSGFTDYHLEKKAKSSDAEFDKISSRVAEYEKALARLKRQKQKQRKKKRAKDYKLDYVVTTPDRRPKNQYKHNPLIYGWSIEADW